jgi:hypothetical protein
MSAALAENERDVIREHPIAGLSSARARGRKGGRLDLRFSCLNQWKWSKSAGPMRGPHVISDLIIGGAWVAEAVGRVRKRLAAGGRWIRTLGPP